MTEPQSPPAARVPLARMILPLVLVMALAGGLSALLLRGGSSKATLPSGAVEAPGAPGGYFGTLTLPARAAPAIDLRDYLGRRRTLAQYRGKAVFVTFLYANCPDVCPLIASNLRVALAQMGPLAAHVQLIAVSVDPRGDTPGEVARFVSSHGLSGRMEYLIGSAAELSRTWSAWSVGSSSQVGKPQLVAHSALVYGVSASGRLTTVYPATFEPSEIVHDAPRLLAH